jgi:hypothetical protein
MDSQWADDAPQTATTEALEPPAIAALRAAGVEVIAWTPAPVVSDPAERAALQAGEERFYDALLDIWTGIIAREMAAEAATCEATQKENTPDRARAEGASAH